MLDTMQLARLAAGLTIGTLLASNANAVPVEWGSTGHYYEYIATDEHITWEDARDAAAAMSFDPGSGALTGYLATLTSEGENLFAASLSDIHGWIGGSDAAVEGQWEWATGPEAGTLFFDGNLPGGGPVPGIYWDFNEFSPNNGFGPTQDYLLHYGGGIPALQVPGDSQGLWVPQPQNEGEPPFFRESVSGYWVEFGDTNLIRVPEPGTLGLFGAGLLALLLSARGRRLRQIRLPRY